MLQKEITLGSEAKNVVTGVTGIVTARITYLNGCIQYAIQPPAEAGKTAVVDPQWTDWQNIDVVGEGISARYQRLDNGGPAPVGRSGNYTG